MTIFENFQLAIAAGNDFVTEAFVAQLSTADAEALISLAAAKDSEERWWAARALANLAIDAVVAPLLALCKDDAAEVRAVAIMALGEVTKRKAPAGDDDTTLLSLLTTVGQHLADDDGAVRQAAVETLAHGKEHSLSVLAEVLQGQHQGARTRAAMALRRMKSPLAAGLLFGCLNDTNYMVHTYAYEALDELGLLETLLLAV